MIRRLEPRDKEVYLAMAHEFYAGPAVDHPVPDVFLERTFDELMRSDVYAEGYLFEEDGQPQGYALLDEVCRGRGFLMRGGVCDLDRACAVILDEFREGKVGKLTLEDPPQTGEEAHDGKTL